LGLLDQRSREQDNKNLIGKKKITIMPWYILQKDRNTYNHPADFSSFHLHLETSSKNS